jgi:hypothetical protein
MPRESKTKATKKTRETRVAYRARTTRARAVKPRVASVRAHTSAAGLWRERIAPSPEQLVDWTLWYNAHAAEFEAKYSGQYLAIWDKQVIATAPTRGEIYKLADQARPEVVAVITFIPRADMPFVLTPFPAEWRK